jgi:hypothetical protein
VINYPAVFQAIENLKPEMERLWLEATEHDKLSPTTKYATFTQSNKAASKFESLSVLIADMHRLMASA